MKKGKTRRGLSKMASSSSIGIANLFSLLTTQTKAPAAAPLKMKESEIRLSSNSISSTSVASVVCPSLAHANTLFFRSAYNVQVIVDDNEPEERLLNRFRREVMRAGVIQESKRRRYFENKQEEKKRKTREAAKRNRKRRPQSRNFIPDRQPETFKGKREDEEKDNWDLPEGELPY